MANCMMGIMAKSNSKWSRVGCIAGAIVGGVGGFIIRGKMNEVEVIGFGNIPDQLAKVACWSLAGAAILAFIGWILGRTIDRS